MCLDSVQRQNIAEERLKIASFDILLKTSSKRNHVVARDICAL